MTDEDAILCLKYLKDICKFEDEKQALDMAIKRMSSKQYPEANIIKGTNKITYFCEVCSNCHRNTPVAHFCMWCGATY